MDPVQTLVYGVVFAMVVAPLGVAIMRHRRGTQPVVADQESANDSGPPSDSGEPPALPATQSLSRRPRGTPREQRQSELFERARSGVCLYCEARATHAAPRLVIPSKNWLDNLLLDKILRRLRIVPFDRHRLDVDALAEHSLCEDHHFLEQARIERKLAQRAMRVADMVLEEREDLYEFMRHGLDEEMSSRADEVRRNAPGKASPLHLVGNGSHTPNGNGG